LWGAGVRGYRLQAALPGRPDLIFGRVRLAVFIHGCFWHQCPKGHLPAPKENAEFWAKKFSENRRRDEAAVTGLEALGWDVMVAWECEIREDIGAVVERVRARIR
jgi:DNA mismatch endonuclease (patch repair protein)